MLHRRVVPRSKAKFVPHSLQREQTNPLVSTIRSRTEEHDSLQASVYLSVALRAIQEKVDNLAALEYNIRSGRVDLEGKERQFWLPKQLQEISFGPQDHVLKHARVAQCLQVRLNDI